MCYQTQWREAVLGLLKAADLTCSDVAKELNVSRAFVSRWLQTKESSQRRTPGPSDVRRVNAAVAKLIEAPDAVDYLFAFALMDGLIDVSIDDLRRSMKAMRSVLKSLDDYFEVSPAELTSVLFKKDAIAAVGLLMGIAAARGKRMTAQLSGRPTRDLLVDEFVWLAEKAGFDLSLFIRTDRESELRRACERAGFVIEGLLAKVDLPPPTRLKLGQEIFGAVVGAQSQTLKILERDALVDRILANAPAAQKSRRCSGSTS